MEKFPSTRVISICSSGHLDVWRLTSRLLQKFVQADEFFVYVPDDEINDFLAVTPPAIKIMPESDLGQEFSSRLQGEMLLADNVDRFGWYFQQFLKIEALIRSTTERVVIWDADCVPLKNIRLFDENDNAVYMKASEHHQEYFRMIQNLLGLTRIQDQSFVIPGFPMKKDWVNGFVQDVESRNDNDKWFDAIISCTDLSQQSGFSEFETLGTWVANSYPHSWISSNLTWERLGQSRFGPAQNFTPEALVKLGQANGLDVISFENWDKRSTRKWLRNGLLWLLRPMRSRKNASSAL